MALDKTVSNVFHIDQPKLDEVKNKNFSARPKEFKYRKCPECGVMMNRVAFGYKSGVIVDHCRRHGFWLDEGELRQLQEWKKAGGEMKQKSLGKGYGHEPKAETNRPEPKPSSHSNISYSGSTSGRRGHDTYNAGDLVFDILGSLFK